LLGFFCPFNHTDPIAIEVVLQPEAGNFVQGIKPVEINVIQGKAAVILSKYDEGGAESIFLDIQAAGEALDQASLARPQLTCEEQDISLLS
jgi:hypothetical protein